MKKYKSKFKEMSATSSNFYLNLSKDIKSIQNKLGIVDNTIKMILDDLENNFPDNFILFAEFHTTKLGIVIEIVIDYSLLYDSTLKATDPVPNIADSKNIIRKKLKRYKSKDYVLSVSDRSISIRIPFNFEY